jgi:hypothetical protein
MWKCVPEYLSTQSHAMNLNNIKQILVVVWFRQIKPRSTIRKKIGHIIQEQS